MPSIATNTRVERAEMLDMPSQEAEDGPVVTGGFLPDRAAGA